MKTPKLDANTLAKTMIATGATLGILSIFNKPIFQHAYWVLDKIGIK